MKGLEPQLQAIFDRLEPVHARKRINALKSTVGVTIRPSELPYLRFEEAVKTAKALAERVAPDSKFLDELGPTPAPQPLVRLAYVSPDEARFKKLAEHPQTDTSKAVQLLLPIAEAAE